MSEKVTIKAERRELHLPAIALRGLVVFPNNLVHFEVGREKSIAAVEWAMANNSNVFLVAQKEMELSDPTQEDLFAYGVVAEVKQVLRVSDDLVKVLVEGKYRAKLTDLDTTGDFLLASVRPAPVRVGKTEDAVETEALLRALKSSFDEYLGMNPRLAKDVVFTIVSSTDPEFLSEYMPANLLFRYEDKQAVMNENTLAGRLQRLVEMLRRECQVMKIEKEIADKVNESMDKNQRDYYLHEQLHVISDELGEGDDTHAEADEYRRKITALHLAEDSEKKLLKEVDRLSKMQGSNQEATVIRTYLDTCLDLPWNSYTEDDLDINRAQQILDRDHYGLKKVKDRILETLAVRKLAPDVKAQIICLVGPPGVGKTSIARSIAESLGRKYVRISLGGVRDEAEIRGHRRTYIGAMPGKIISAMITAKSSNPLMLLDEIDKLAGDFRGDPAAALLEALDPEQNSTFNDHFLDIPFDLSHVLFITTANDLGSIPGPLRDRMDVIELPSYTRVEKYNIARKHLLPKQLKACGLTGKVTLSQSALYGIIDGYTREAGVRNLERTITSVLRKCARKIASGEAETVSVTGSMLEDLLGPRFVKPDFLNRTNAVGIANGLAWTSVGGETLPIDRFAGRCDEGERSAGCHLGAGPCAGIRHRPGAAQEVRPAHPRPGGCCAQGRPLGRCYPDHSAGVLPVRPAGAWGCGHDGRDHPPRQRAAHRRPARKEHGSLPRGHEDGAHPQGQRAGSLRGGRGGQEESDLPAHAEPDPGAERRAAQADERQKDQGSCQPQPQKGPGRGEPGAPCCRKAPDRGCLLTKQKGIPHDLQQS